MNNHKHGKGFIESKKKEMRQALGNFYTNPAELTSPTFEVKVITRYDRESGEKYKDSKIAVDTNLFVEQFFDGLHGGLFTLVSALITHADKEGFSFPSIATLTKETGLSKSTIIRYMEDYSNAEIKGRVLFYKMGFSKGKNHTVNMYYIPDCRVFFEDEIEEQTDEEKSEDVASITKKVFNPQSA